MRRIKTSVTLEPEVLEFVRAKAKEHDRSVADMINVFLKGIKNADEKGVSI
jgi:hypothetical protein